MSRDFNDNSKLWQYRNCVRRALGDWKFQISYFRHSSKPEQKLFWSGPVLENSEQLKFYEKVCGEEYERIGNHFIL